LTDASTRCSAANFSQYCTSHAGWMGKNCAKLCCQK
jgi:hypothetical protein